MKTRITQIIRILFLFLSILGITLNSHSQGIDIQAGASFSVTGNASILIDNGNFVNNGTYSGETETFTFSGATTARSVSGSSNTDIYDLEITNSAGVTTQFPHLTLHNLNIGTGSKLNIAPNKFVTVNGTITNYAGNSGLVIKSTALGTGSLEHFSDGVPATVERYIENNNAWHFLSSPVESQTIWPSFTPAPTGNSFGAGSMNWDFYYFNPNAVNAYPHTPWVNIRKIDGTYNDATIDEIGDDAGFGSATPEFEANRGYLVAYANDYGTTEMSFAGNLNVGSQTMHVIYNSFNGWNLKGNPYPSAIDWKSVSGWDRSPLYGDDVSNGRDYWCWNESAGNYGTFNSVDVDDVGTNGTSRYIAPAQGFFLLAASTGDVTLNDDVRAQDSQSWLKSTSTYQNYLKLKISSDATSYSDEISVKLNPAYLKGGSMKFWSLYSEAPEIFISEDGNAYSTLRIPSIDANTELIVGFKAGLTANYSLTANNLDDFEPQDVILEDKVTGIFQDLKEIPVYTFEATQAGPTNRFILHFKNLTGMNPTVENINVNVYSAGHTLFIAPVTRTTDYTVTISDMLGQKVYQQNLMGDNLNRIELNLCPSVYVVTIQVKGKTVSKKIVIR